MIRRLSIRNFKSLKELEIDCKRINLLIGEPNTGKSNILELLGLLGWFNSQNVPLGEYVRFQSVQDLFYGGDFKDESVRVRMDTEAGPGIGLEMGFEDDAFKFYFKIYSESGEQSIGTRTLDKSGTILDRTGDLSALTFVKSYNFKKQDRFPEEFSSFLMPPHGSNLFAVTSGNEKVKEIVSRFFLDFDLKLILNPHDKTFEFQKQTENKDGDSAFSYPYTLTPDTLQRILFYIIAIESNEGCTLVFEEPESHAFPYYAKYLGEKIAFDERNQYFMATHNPYLLLSILEKAPEDSVSVFIAHSREHQTKVRCLSSEEVSELMDYDPFFNLHSFVKDEEEE